MAWARLIEHAEAAAPGSGGVIALLVNDLEKSMRECTESMGWGPTPGRSVAVSLGCPLAKHRSLFCGQM
jgi:hypothetical protein